MSKILIRSGGDLASGIAASLFRSGHTLLITELKKPATVRRTVAFSEAVYTGQTKVEDIKASSCKSSKRIEFIQNKNEIPVIIDRELKSLDYFSPDFLVDARMLKRNVEYELDKGFKVIGLGPGFVVGENCHYAVETMRGKNLGKIIKKGSPQDDTGVPGVIEGKTEERVLRSPDEGIMTHHKKIGDRLRKDELISEINGKNIRSPFNGVLRGLIHPSYFVKKGMKIGDVDPRTNRKLCFSISDKALTIGKAVLNLIEQGESNK